MNQTTEDGWTLLDEETQFNIQDDEKTEAGGKLMKLPRTYRFYNIDDITEKTETESDEDDK